MYKMNQNLRRAEYSDYCKYSKGTFTSNYTTVLKKEHQLYEELNARHRATGEKCNDTMCGFPECERCTGYKTAYCQYYSKDTLRVAKRISASMLDVGLVFQFIGHHDFFIFFRNHLRKLIGQFYLPFVRFGFASCSQRFKD